MKKPTKKELIQIRKDSYKEPSEKRCETCEHFNKFGFGWKCHAIEIRGEIQEFICNPAGLCDLWEART